MAVTSLYRATGWYLLIADSGDPKGHPAFKITS